MKKVNNVWTITAPNEKVIPTNANNWNINEIESIPEFQAAEMAEETMIVKDHNVYFVTLEKYFGFSVLVYYNGHHIYYVNDYELHHKGKTKEELKQIYIKKLNTKLYTESELKAPLKSYADYENRDYFLRNYYGMRYNYVSFFGNFNSEEYKNCYLETTANLYKCGISFAWYELPEIPQKIAELHNAIETAKNNVADNFDYWYKGFYHEFFNYECSIGGRYDEAAAAVLRGIKPNETIEKAYKAAKRDFINYCNEHDIY